MEEPPPHFHPLAGCDLRNYSAHLAAHDGFTDRTKGQRSKSYLAVLAREPFTFIEKLVFSKKVANYQLPHPPIFFDWTLAKRNNSSSTI